MIKLINATNLTNNSKRASKENTFYVVHPLHDKAEEKRNTEGLGFIELTPTVKASLMTLRLYLILMVGLVVFRVLKETGIV